MVSEHQPTLIEQFFCYIHGTNLEIKYQAQQILWNQHKAIGSQGQFERHQTTSGFDGSHSVLEGRGMIKMGDGFIDNLTLKITHQIMCTIFSIIKILSTLSSWATPKLEPII